MFDRITAMVASKAAKCCFDADYDGALSVIAAELASFGMDTGAEALANFVALQDSGGEYLFGRAYRAGMARALEARALEARAPEKDADAGAAPEKDADAGAASEKDAAPRDPLPHEPPRAPALRDFVARRAARDAGAGAAANDDD